MGVVMYKNSMLLLFYMSGMGVWVYSGLLYNLKVSFKSNLSLSIDDKINTANHLNKVNSF